MHGSFPGIASAKILSGCRVWTRIISMGSGHATQWAKIVTLQAPLATESTKQAGCIVESNWTKIPTKKNSSLTGACDEGIWNRKTILLYIFNVSFNSLRLNNAVRFPIKDIRDKCGSKSILRQYSNLSWYWHTLLCWPPIQVLRKFSDARLKLLELKKPLTNMHRRF